MSDQKPTTEEQSGSPSADELEREVREFERSLRPKRHDYVRFGLAIALILGVFIGVLFGAMYFIASAEDAIRETVRQLYPAPPAKTDTAPEAKGAVAPAGDKATDDATAPTAAAKDKTAGDKPTGDQPAQKKSSAKDLTKLKIVMTPDPTLPAPVQAAARRSKPMIVFFKKTSAIGFGNAVMLEDGLAVTSYHIYQFAQYNGGLEALFVKCTEEGPIVSALPIAGSMIADVLFLVTSCKAPPIKYRQTRPHGLPAWISGIHYEMEDKKIGLWIRKDRLDRRTKIVNNTAKCLGPETIEALKEHLAAMKRAGYQSLTGIRLESFKGNSGSLVHDDQGRMLGIIFGASCRNVSFLVPTANILEVAKRSGLTLGKQDRQND